MYLTIENQHCKVHAILIGNIGDGVRDYGNGHILSTSDYLEL